MGINHENANRVIEEIIAELNKDLAKKVKNPGGTYNQPVILRNMPGGQMAMNEITEEQQYALQEYKTTGYLAHLNSITPIVRNIKDAQAKSKALLGRTILGYVFMSRWGNSPDLKVALQPMVEQLRLDVMEFHGAMPSDRFMGESFLTFVKNADGNYFTELSDAAGYQLIAVSDCARMPPLVLNCKSASPEFWKQFNISWNN